MDSAAPRIVDAGSSPLALPETSSLRREPRAPGRRRSAAFYAGFEDRMVFYDLFRHADGERLLFVGPPPMNFEPMLAGAELTALPSGKRLTLKLHVSQSVTIGEIGGAPPDTEAVRFSIAGMELQADVRPSMVELFAGARMLFTINRNNRLEWIAEWARWHAVTQGTDAVVLVDNGSDAYSTEDIETVLAGIEGLRLICVLSWPYKFGPRDPAVIFNRFWARFLQLSVMSVVLRRFGTKAEGLINCDIDELAVATGAADLYAAARASEYGLVRMSGQWVESVREDGDDAGEPAHLAFRTRLRGAKALLSPPKWVLDPSRDWVGDLGVHPHWHKIKTAPKPALKFTGAGRFWHFRGINTNWKDGRALDERFSPRRHVLDAELDAAMADYRARRRVLIP